jgi:hypothetical protein
LDSDIKIFVLDSDMDSDVEPYSDMEPDPDAESEPDPCAEQDADPILEPHAEPKPKADQVSYCKNVPTPRYVA